MFHAATPAAITCRKFADKIGVDVDIAISSEKSCSELIFIFSHPSWTYIYHNNFHQKMFMKWFHNIATQKNIVKVPCFSVVNQLLCMLLKQKPPEKLSNVNIFTSLQSFQIKKWNINNSLCQKILITTTWC